MLHIAALARLRLSDAEVEAMAHDLDRDLDHVARLSELDLEGVPPTSPGVVVAGALRPDEPRPCLPREVVLSQAPAVVDDGFAVPSPQA